MTDRPLKQAVMEPQIYAIILHSKKNAILHLGIHFSLDDAIAAATPALLASGESKPTDRIEVEMWTSLSAKHVVRAVLDSNEIPAMTKEIPIRKTAKEQFEEMKKIKNELMAKIIATKDEAFLRQHKNAFTKAEIKYIENSMMHLLTKSI